MNVLLTDHFSLKFLQSWKCISHMHARWISFLQRFDFVIKHQSSKVNKAADASSRKGCLLTVLAEVIASAHLPDLYDTDVDFNLIGNNCSHNLAMYDSHIFYGFLSKGDSLFIPHTSLCEVLIKELHCRALAGHFGRDKTFELLS